MAARHGDTRRASTSRGIDGRCDARGDDRQCEKNRTNTHNWTLAKHVRPPRECKAEWPDTVNYTVLASLDCPILVKVRLERCWLLSAGRSLNRVKGVGVETEPSPTPSSPRDCATLRRVLPLDDVRVLDLTGVRADSMAGEAALFIDHLLPRIHALCAEP